MGIDQTYNQKIENTRVILQLAHKRNENLTSYIRLTDGAIWGFLGLAVIELFKDGIQLKSLNLPIFLTLLIISMYFWRLRVMAYQDGIVKGYYRIVNCEYNLHIPYYLTLRKNLCIDINPKPKSFSDLCKLLEPEEYIDRKHALLNKIKLFFGCSQKYTDKDHTISNYIAVFFGLIAFGLLVSYFYALIFLNLFS